jgi:hypothetical protein
MALLILSDMAEREAALGYTAPHRSAGSITFALPSFSNIGISRLDDCRKDAEATSIEDLKADNGKPTKSAKSRSATPISKHQQAVAGIRER